MTSKARRNRITLNAHRRSAALARRLSAAEWAVQFDEALDAAATGQTEKLCVYLESVAPLTPLQREKLAQFIYRILRPKGRGRPKGPDSSPRAYLKRLVVRIVQRKEGSWHAEHPGKYLPRKLRQEFIKFAFCRLQDDPEFQGVSTITESEIVDILRKK